MLTRKLLNCCRLRVGFGPGWTVVGRCFPIDSSVVVCFDSGFGSSSGSFEGLIKKCNQGYFVHIFLLFYQVAFLPYFRFQENTQKVSCYLIVIFDLLDGVDDVVCCVLEGSEHKKCLDIHVWPYGKMLSRCLGRRGSVTKHLSRFLQSLVEQRLLACDRTAFRFAQLSHQTET